MRELWEVICEGSWEDRLYLAAVAAILAGMAVAFYEVVWLIGGGG